MLRNCKSLFHRFHKNRKSCCRVCFLRFELIPENAQSELDETSPCDISNSETKTPARYLFRYTLESVSALLHFCKALKTFCANEQASAAPRWTSVQTKHLSLQKQHSLNICISHTHSLCGEFHLMRDVKCALSLSLFCYTARISECSERGSAEWFFALMRN